VAPTRRRRDGYWKGGYGMKYRSSAHPSYADPSTRSRYRRSVHRQHRAPSASTGRFPNGITPAAPKRDHLSVLRNPIIADAFHRSGLIEKWGRGTNRVAEMCVAAGIAAPEFQELTGGVVVTFRVPVAGSDTESRVKSEPDLTPQVVRLLGVLRGEVFRADLQKRLDVSDRKYFRTNFLRPALDAGLIEMTNPDRPRSSSQRYRLSGQGRMLLKGKARGRDR
jgi:ATP-dependent DNA helicase RecG